MASASPLDENSFDDPRRIAPVTSALRSVSAAFTHELPPYSLTILRIR